MFSSTSLRAYFSLSFFSTKNIPYLYKLEWFLQKKEKEMAMTNRQIENNAVHEYSTARERAASERAREREQEQQNIELCGARLHQVSRHHQLTIFEYN